MPQASHGLNINTVLEQAVRTDLYDRIGLDPSRARSYSTDDIKRICVARMALVYPDRVQGDPERHQLYLDATQRIGEVKATLTDQGQKDQYDAGIIGRASRWGTASASKPQRAQRDPFESFFGGRNTFEEFFQDLQEAARRHKHPGARRTPTPTEEFADRLDQALKTDDYTTMFNCLNAARDLAKANEIKLADTPFDDIAIECVNKLCAQAVNCLDPGIMRKTLGIARYLAQRFEIELSGTDLKHATTECVNSICAQASECTTPQNMNTNLAEARRLAHDFGIELVDTNHKAAAIKCINAVCRDAKCCEMSFTMDTFLGAALEMMQTYEVPPKETDFLVAGIACVDKLCRDALSFIDESFIKNGFTIALGLMEKYKIPRGETTFDQSLEAKAASIEREAQSFNLDSTRARTLKFAQSLREEILTPKQS